MLLPVCEEASAEGYQEEATAAGLVDDRPAPTTSPGPMKVDDLVVYKKGVVAVVVGIHTNAKLKETVWVRLLNGRGTYIPVPRKLLDAAICTLDGPKADPRNQVKRDEWTIGKRHA